MTDDGAVWVYAVAHRIDNDWLDGATGVDGNPVRAVEAAGLAAAVTAVSLDEFGEEPLRRHLEDLSWLDATARMHHQVIEIIAQHGPVVPMRLATVFHGDGSVADMLTQRREGFAAALHQVTARMEWGVKVYAAPPGNAPAAPAAGSASESGRAVPDAAASPGAAYLRRRRKALSADNDARRAALASADTVHATLGRLAAAVQLRPPQAPQLSGQAARMTLNAAYLVDEDRSEDFAAAVNSLAKEHSAVSIELTGPWPPYSFVTVDPPEVAGDGTPS
jgi:hypothetical protein